MIARISNHGFPVIRKEAYLIEKHITTLFRYNESGTS